MKPAWLISWRSLAVRRKASIWFFDGVSLLVLASSIALFSSLYVLLERCFYDGESWEYQKLAISVFRQYQASSSWTIWEFLKGGDRTLSNSLFVLPILPLFEKFGISRLTYILGLGLGYFLPFCLSLGAVATQILVVGNCRGWFWGTAFLGVLLPISFAPTLRGLPDAAAMLWICGAVFGYLKLARQRQPRFGLSLLWLAAIAFCLAMAIIFEPFIIWSAIAFLLAIAIWETLQPSPTNFWHEWRTLARILFLISIATLILFGLAASLEGVYKENIKRQVV